MITKRKFKLILIVIILAAVIGGIFLWFTGYLGSPRSVTDPVSGNKILCKRVAVIFKDVAHSVDIQNAIRSVQGTVVVQNIDGLYELSIPGPCNAEEVFRAVDILKNRSEVEIAEPVFMGSFH